LLMPKPSRFTTTEIFLLKLFLVIAMMI
jgi:hypothetical protein